MILQIIAMAFGILKDFDMHTYAIKIAKRFSEDSRIQITEKNDRKF